MLSVLTGTTRGESPPVGQRGALCESNGSDLRGPCHVLLDDVGRLEQDRLGDGQPECLGGLEVDDQVERGRLLDRKIGPRGRLSL